MSQIQHRRARLILTVTALLGVLSYAGIMESVPDFSRTFLLHDALGCCMRITKGLMVPSIVLLAITSRLAPTRTWATTWYAVAAGSLLTSLVSQLNCPIDNAWHVLVGHGVMVVATAGLALWILGLGLRLFLKIKS